MVFLCQVSWTQTETCLLNADDPDNRIISQVTDLDTIYREYVLKIPSSYSADIPSALIINLHGFGDCSTDYAQTIGSYYNFSELAELNNLIVAYPQGAYRPEKEDTYWEPGDTGIEDIYKNDVYFIEKLIEDIGSDFNVNAEMIYACGYSNGGMMAYSLACNRSNLFSAIGIMSGTMLQEECDLERPVPIIKFHGIDDGVLPYHGSIWYQSVEEVINFWLEQNEIPSGNLASSQLNGGKVQLDEYKGENSCLSLYTVYEEFDKPGDHVWFSDEIDGLTPSNIMWKFFEDNCDTVSSTENDFADIISLFPNPVSSQLHILNAVNSYYKVFDINGKLMLLGKVNSDFEIIEFQNLNEGIYFVKLGDQVEKVVKVD